MLHGPDSEYMHVQNTHQPNAVISRCVASCRQRLDSVIDAAHNHPTAAVSCAIDARAVYTGASIIRPVRVVYPASVGIVKL